MALRLASNKTTRIKIGDEDYIDVLSDISRRQFSELMRIVPRQEELSVEDAEGFTVALFSLFVKGWSVTDEDGTPVAPTEENYYALSREASGLVDNAVIEHFNSLTPTSQEQKKSERDSTT